MSRLKWIAPVLALVLVAGACSSDDSSESSSTTAGASASSSDLCAAADVGEVKIVHLTDVVGESNTAIDDFWNGSQLAAKEINDECGKEVVSLERVPTDFSVAGFQASFLTALEMEPTAIISQGSSSQMAEAGLVTEGQVPSCGRRHGLGAARERERLGVRLDDPGGQRHPGSGLGRAPGRDRAENVWLECVQTQLGVSGCGEATPILEENDVAIAGRADSAFDASDFTTSILDLEQAGCGLRAARTVPTADDRLRAADAGQRGTGGDQDVRLHVAPRSSTRRCPPSSRTP